MFSFFVLRMIFVFISHAFRLVSAFCLCLLCSLPSCVCNHCQYFSTQLLGPFLISLSLFSLSLQSSVVGSHSMSGFSVPLCTNKFWCHNRFLLNKNELFYFSFLCYAYKL